MKHAKFPCFFNVPAGIFDPSFLFVDAIVALVKKLFKRIIALAPTFRRTPEDTIPARSIE